MKNLLCSIALLIVLNTCLYALECKWKIDYIKQYNIATKNTGRKAIEYYEKPSEETLFPRGQEALIKYIQENLNYPIKSVNNEIEGKVIVRFLVSPSWALLNHRIEKSPSKGEELVKEALRIVRRMP